MVFSSYKKLRVVFFHHFFHRKGLKATAISKYLLQEGMVASRFANSDNVLVNGDNVL